METAAVNLRAEYRLLMLLSRIDLDAEDRAAVRELLAKSTDIDWGLFIDAAGRHRVLPLAAGNLARYDLAFDESDGHRLLPYWWLFAGVPRANGERNAVLRAGYAPVLRALTEAGVPYVVRKGPAIGERLYGDSSLRVTNDLDIMVAESDLPRFADCLTSVGFQQGRLDRTRARIEPFSRSTTIYWKVHLVNELPFVRAAGFAGVDQYIVDAVTSTLHSAAARPGDTAEVLARAVPTVLHGEPSFVLDWPDWLHNLAVHLYEEAVSPYHIRRGKDLRLQKFVDIAAIVRASRGQDDWDRFAALVSQYRTEREIYYTLHHTDLVFPGVVPPHILAALRPTDLVYLDEYGGLKRPAEAWSQPFLVRLFDTSRRHVAEGLQIPPSA
ncbi:nucleotidyltransferase family protein [Nonomuraea sp. NPDC050451]|uniref:nucleotidyltransferase family protein n=1 Tax=Nonomuraea sp. NPDC050451 TaxID=3364364 RepID=UPI00379A360A